MITTIREDDMIALCEIVERDGAFEMSEQDFIDEMEQDTEVDADTLKAIYKLCITDLKDKDQDEIDHFDTESSIEEMLEKNLEAIVEKDTKALLIPTEEYELFETYYPNYTSSNEVLRLDDLDRFIDNELDEEQISTYLHMSKEEAESKRESLITERNNLRDMIFATAMLEFLKIALEPISYIYDAVDCEGNYEQDFITEVMSRIHSLRSLTYQSLQQA